MTNQCPKLPLIGWLVHMQVVICRLIHIQSNDWGRLESGNPWLPLAKSSLIWVSFLRVKEGKRGKKILRGMWLAHFYVSSFPIGRYVYLEVSERMCRLLIGQTAWPLRVIGQIHGRSTYRLSSKNFSVAQSLPSKISKMNKSVSNFPFFPKTS